MILTLVSTLVVLSVLILFHEFGHFIVAKRSGIKVEIFSLGMGLRLIGIKKGDTDYRISLVPFGGYIKMAGEDLKDVKGEGNEFPSKSPGVRASVIVAGPVFNLVLAWVGFTIVSFMQGNSEIPTTFVQTPGKQINIQTGDKFVSVNGIETKTWNDVISGISKKDSVSCEIERNNEIQKVMVYGESLDIAPKILPIVGRVIKQGVAWKAGIRENDVINQIIIDSLKDTIQINNWDTLVTLIQNNARKEITFLWTRDSTSMSAVLVPEKKEYMDENNKIKEIGMVGVQLKTVRKPITLIGGFKDGFVRTWDVALLTLKFFKNLFAGKMSTKALGGPVSIGKFAGESARWGLDSFILLISFLSIQLFLLNLMPFPPLDGGQIFIIGIEKLQKRPVPEKTIILIQNIGFSLLMLFMVYVTFNDITRIFKK
ncbi:MAG: RIP metalloprotease RseP [bacterium]|nr:RIP metalloprotease RseP [bacterium]